MRFFHLGDLHFGKLVHNVPMVERDQPYWVERFLEAVDEHHPQAVVIAGDVYDRRVPSVEAVKLFDHMLTELAAREVVVLVIAGNHDSGVRLSFAEELLKHQKIFIAGEVKKELQKVTLSDEHGPVDFYLMPYLYPKAVADVKVLDQPEIDSYDAAVQALLQAQHIDKDRRNVILVHQNVLANGNKPEHSDSETIVGGLGEIDASAFDAFDYVAMGHIHNAQKMGREEVRYAGCPIYYDFSECGRDKSLTMVDLQAKGEKVEITRVPIALLHEMERISGTVEELCADDYQVGDLEHKYLQIILEDTHLPAHAMERLKTVFGENLLHVVRKPKKSEGIDDSTMEHQKQEESVSMREQFADFYYKQNGELMSDNMLAILDKIMEQQERCGGEYVTGTEQVLVEDTREMIRLLLEEDDA